MRGVNPLLAALDPIAVRQGRKLLGGLPAAVPPPGLPHGVIGVATGARQLVVVGDEFGTGGLDDWDRTLPAMVAAAAGGDVVWQAVVTEGCTIRQAHQELVGRLGRELDAVVLALGWADVIARTDVDEWRRELDATVRLLARTGTVVVTGCPPVRSMPRLRQPLTSVLAARADAFDAASVAVCSERGATFVAAPTAAGPDAFQADGVHLAAGAVADLAGRVAAALWR